jgi:hypothetical protein
LRRHRSTEEAWANLEEVLLWRSETGAGYTKAKEEADDLHQPIDITFS